MIALLLAVAPHALAADPLTISPTTGATLTVGAEDSTLTVQAGIRPWNGPVRLDLSLGAGLGSDGTSASIVSGGTVDGTLEGKFFLAFENAEKAKALIGVLAADDVVSQVRKGPVNSVLSVTDGSTVKDGKLPVGTHNDRVLTEKFVEFAEAYGTDVTQAPACKPAAPVLPAPAPADGAAKLGEAAAKPAAPPAECAVFAEALVAYQERRPQFDREMIVRHRALSLRSTGTSEFTWGIEGEGKFAPVSAVNADDLGADPTSRSDWSASGGLRVQHTMPKWALSGRAGVGGSQSVSTSTTELCERSETGNEALTAESCAEVTILDAEPEPSAEWYAGASFLAISYGEGDTTAPGLEARMDVKGGFTGGLTLTPGLLAFVMDMKLPGRPRTGVGLEYPLDPTTGKGSTNVYGFVGLDL